MAIPAILQGDDSGAITIALADGHTYDGATLVVVFNGVSRQYTNLAAGGSVSLVFTAEETAGMPLGTAMVNMRLVGANGGVETVGNADARIKVTDCVAEVNAGGSFAVTPGSNPLEGVAGLGTRYTGDQLRAKINEVIAKLGGTVAALLLCALPCLGGVLEVQTAPLGEIYNDERVVTNVTFDASSVVPGDYANVSNAAMKAAAATNDFLRTAGGMIQGDIDMGGRHGAAEAEPMDSAFIKFMEYRLGYGELGRGFGIYEYSDGFLDARYTFNGGRWTSEYGVDTDVMTREDLADALGDVQPPDLSEYATKSELGTVTNDLAAAADAATNYTDWAIQNIAPDIPVFDVYAADVTNVAETVTSNAISTNNAAFVEAVRSTPLAGADPSDLAEIGEYGSYGTVGAAILALIAGLAALKRGKADKTELPYDIVAVTPSNGVVTVLPRTVTTYTAGDSAAAFTVAVGTGTSGKARDCELIIDCTATGAAAPTVTWPSTFHPRTDAATDFACEAGKRNVYFISEFAAGEFAVGGWQETAGGNE